jgi:hypothetical protein
MEKIEIDAKQIPLNSESPEDFVRWLGSQGITLHIPANVIGAIVWHFFDHTTGQYLGSGNPGDGIICGLGAQLVIVPEDVWEQISLPG